MNSGNKSQEKEHAHSVSLENRRKMTLTGVVEVVSATDKTIITKTLDKTINIIGTELRVAKLNLEEGLLIIEGVVDCFKYLGQSKGFFKKVFK